MVTEAACSTSVNSLHRYFTSTYAEGTCVLAPSLRHCSRRGLASLHWRFRDMHPATRRLAMVCANSCATGNKPLPVYSHTCREVPLTSRKTLAAGRRSAPDASCGPQGANLHGSAHMLLAPGRPPIARMTNASAPNPHKGHRLSR